MREDLVQLTPEAIAALANVGLVKRAQREIEQGKGPTLVERDDGTVVGTFEDGVVAKLVRGRVLRDCLCSCSAPGVCRHRVAVALAYPTFARSLGPAPESAPPPPVSPAVITDEALDRLLGRRPAEEARAVLRRGVVVEILRGEGEPPTARLPTCTVRFHVPSDPAYARCDCATGQRCAHVALAVWAFREADRRDPAARALTLEICSGPAESAADDGADALASALVHDVVATGVGSAREALAQRFALARDALERSGRRWQVDALDDLELALARHRARSARYRAADALACCLEIVARGRAARAGGALPAAAMLGRGEASETKLDHLRLVGLGARFDSDGEERSAEILFADPDTAMVLVLHKTWSFPVGTPAPEGPELARRRIGAGSIAALASGQLVTRTAKRRANRALTLGAATHGASSVLPQTGDLSMLPPPLRVEHVRELDAIVGSRAPRLLRPRVQCEDVHAIAVGSVAGVVFDAAEQTLVAQLLDPQGEPFLLRRGHRKAAPAALDVLAATLAGAHGALRWVVGPVAREAERYVVEPTMVVADRVVVPDVEEAPQRGLERGVIRAAPDAVGRALARAGSLLEEVVQLGPAGVSASFDARAREALDELRGLALASVARRLEALRVATLEARDGDPSAVARAARACIDAGIRVAVAAERAASPVTDATATAPAPS